MSGELSREGSDRVLIRFGTMGLSIGVETAVAELGNALPRAGSEVCLFIPPSGAQLASSPSDPELEESEGDRILPDCLRLAPPVGWFGVDWYWAGNEVGGIEADCFRGTGGGEDLL